MLKIFLRLYHFLEMQQCEICFKKVIIIAFYSYYYKQQ